MKRNNMRAGQKSSSQNGIKNRIVLVGVFFSLLYAVILSRVVYLQVCDGETLGQRASREYRRTCVVMDKRGTIYDRNHTEMAVSIDTTSIGAHPQRIATADDKVRQLATALGCSASGLQRKLGSDSSFVWLKRSATPTEEAAARKIGFDAGQLEFIAETKRVYPNKKLAAQLFGFAGVDGNGLEGLEYSCNNYLKGTSRNYVLFKDALGRKFDVEDVQAGTAQAESSGGNNLILTIDGTIQCIAEEALEQAVTKSKALSGMAVVMNPGTGEVLAMANYPFFNPNAFNDYDQSCYRNRIVTDAFEPGSTMKVFLAAGALEAGVCTPNSIFYCENGVYRIQHNYRVHDHDPYEWLSLRQIVQHSSNIGAVKVSEMIGSQVLWETLRKFGFGAATGIRCPGETAGILADYSRWTEVDTSSIAFGQGVSVSAIQLATAVSAIANGGILLKPRVVNAVVSPKGQIIQAFAKNSGYRIISETTAREITRMMATVTSDGGTGEKADLPGYTVCGKTGTAQKQEKGKYAKEEYIASFVGFVPEKNPRLTILVVVDSPFNGHYGGQVAAPAFRQIAWETLNYLGVPPNLDMPREHLMVSIKKGSQT